MSRSNSPSSPTENRPTVGAFTLRLASPSERGPIEKFARILWIVLAIALTVKPLIEKYEHTTYPGYETGSRAFLNDVDPYSSSWFEYRYSPSFATAFSVFTLLPARLGGMLWNLLSLGTLWIGLTRLSRDVLPQRWSGERQGAFLALSAFIAFRGLWASQSTPIVIGLVCIAASDVVLKNWWRAALFLAIPVTIKIWPVAIAMLLMSCFPRKLSWRFAIMLGLVALLPLVIKSREIVWWQYQNWYAGLVGPVSQIRHIYRDFWVIWEVLAPPVSPRGYIALQLGSALGVLGLCLWQRFKAPTIQQSIIFTLAIWSVWQLSVGPGVERNTYCMFAPALAWALVSSAESRYGRPLLALSFPLIALFSFGLFERELVERIPLVLGALPIGALLCGLWTVLYARRWPEPFAKNQSLDVPQNSQPRQECQSLAA